MIGKHVAAFVAASVIAAPPAAAQDFRETSASVHAPAAFAGMTVRVPLGGKATPVPRARLQLTTYRTQASKWGPVRTFSPAGLELGIAKSGKPLFFAGGSSTAQIKHKMGLNSTTTLLVIGGALVAVAVVAVALGNSGLGDTCPEFEGSRDHCIDP